MQFGKFHLKKKSRLIALHSSGDDGALTNSSLSTAHITLHVSFRAEQTVDFPSRKLNESDTYKIISIYKQIMYLHNTMYNAHLGASTCQIS